MSSEQHAPSRNGLSIPTEWWPASPLLEEIADAGFGWVQLPAPPTGVLVEPRSCIRHARGAGAAVGAAGLRSVLHAPAELLAGTPADDRGIEGALAYAAECGAAAVVLHARSLREGPGSGDRMLAETRSLARLAPVAERLGVTLALENLAPVYPGPETVSANPLALRSLARRISSPAVGLCLDVGHANVVAGLRRTSLTRMVEPVLDMVALLHVHDNLGARWFREDRPELDPLRLDLHLPPGQGSLPWEEVAPSLLAHKAPMIWEIHPPRPRPEELMGAIERAMGRTGTSVAGRVAAAIGRNRSEIPERITQPHCQPLKPNPLAPQRDVSGGWRGAQPGRPPDASERSERANAQAGWAPRRRAAQRQLSPYVCLTTIDSIELAADRAQSIASSSAT